MNFGTSKHVTCKQLLLLFFAQCGFTALMQRIFTCGKNENSVLTPDKVLNVLMCESFRFVEIWP